LHVVKKLHDEEQHNSPAVKPMIRILVYPEKTGFAVVVPPCYMTGGRQ